MTRAWYLSLSLAVGLADYVRVRCTGGTAWSREVSSLDGLFLGLIGGRAKEQQRARRVKESLARWTTATSRKNSREKEGAAKEVDKMANNATSGDRTLSPSSPLPRRPPCHTVMPRPKTPAAAAAAYSGYPWYARPGRKFSAPLAPPLCLCPRAFSRAEGGGSALRRGQVCTGGHRGQAHDDLSVKALIPVGCPPFGHTHVWAVPPTPAPLPPPPQQPPTHGALNYENNGRMGG